MAQNQGSDIIQFDAIGSPSQVSVAPATAYTVAANVNRVQAGAAITVTLSATSNSPCYIDSNSHITKITDGTRTYSLGDTAETISAMCIKVGGSGNDWIVVGAVLD